MGPKDATEKVTGMVLFQYNQVFLQKTVGLTSQFTRIYGKEEVQAGNVISGYSSRGFRAD